MIKRLTQIIERERQRHPGKPAVILLGNRAIEVATHSFKTWRMRMRKDSTFTEEADLFMCSLLPTKVLSIVLDRVQPKTLLDVGCGTGMSLQYFLDHQVDATGVENSDIAIERSPVKAHIIKHNLNHVLDLKKQFDLVWCFEVIEHIHPAYEKNFLRTLVNHGNRIILSAARPGQGGHGHFNEQEPAYWIDRFAALGYDYEAAFAEELRATGETHSENLLCFAKRER
jgi:SAM-dependent methyltransferase